MSESFVVGAAVLHPAGDHLGLKLASAGRASPAARPARAADGGGGGAQPASPAGTSRPAGPGSSELT